MARSGRAGAPFGAAFVLGLALSGFFDGVLLHQILQWHHLLSLVDAEAVRSLQAQVLADGLFHALMYLVAVAGLVLLWRQREGLAAPGGSRRLWSGVVVGFGVWNVLDIGLFHWIRRLHHIRLDVPNPVAWDVGWLVGLGLLPTMLGLAIGGLARSRRSGPGASAGALVVLLTVTGGWNLRPPPAGADTLVLFRPGADVMSAVVAADAKLVQLHAGGSMAVLRLAPDTPPWRLYQHGALLVQGAGPSGCFNWSSSRPNIRNRG